MLKVAKLAQIEPILTNFNFAKIDKFAQEYVMYETTIDGKDLNDIIITNDVWVNWQGDNWDLLSGNYISPHKELDCFLSEDDKSNLSQILEKYNFWNEVVEANTSDHFEVPLFMPLERLEDALRSFDDLLHYFPNHTGALLSRGTP